MNPGRVTLVVRRFTVGGLERVVAVLANELVRRDLSVQVVILEGADLRASVTELDPQVQVHVLQGGTSARLRRLRELAAGGIVHLHLADGLIHPRVRWALRGHPAVFVSYHSDYTPVRNRFTNRLDRAITGRSLRAIAVSEAVAAFCVREVGLRPEHVAVICNAVAAPRSGTVQVKSAGGFVLVALATVNPHKDYGTLIRGLAALRSRGHDVSLRIIGDGPATRTAFTTAVEAGVTAHIEWYGALWKGEIVSALLESSDVFVSASRNEGLPMSVLEALQSGLPLVLSDIAPHREVAGAAALYFPEQDAAAFADQVEALFDEQARMRQASLAQERSRAFSVEEFVDRHLAVYAAAGPAA